MGSTTISNAQAETENAGKTPEETPVSRRRNRLLPVFLLGLVLLPAMLSPTHPLAVYAYIATTYSPFSQPVHAGSEGDLAPFLVSDAQVAQYRAELLADMAETTSGKLFAIVRNPDGTLEHAPLRTWNGFLPNNLPSFMTGLLDRKEIPFLGDHVALWLADKTIVAMGHYHVFGGGPSEGDHIAQSMSELPEVVVSNGIVPLVYLRGNLLSYGADVDISPELFRSFRTLERGITMETRYVPCIIENPSDGMRAVLAYFRDRQGVDITDRYAIATAIRDHCMAFKAAYSPFFPAGFLESRYLAHPDHYSVVTNLTSLTSWSNFALSRRLVKS